MTAVLFGPPGAGKGTVASTISERSGLPHVSTGDLFREAIRAETDLGTRVKQILDSGALVPDELTIDLVRERLSAEDAQQGCLLDGFPRTITQADALTEIATVDRVINLVTTEETIIKRLSGRRLCSSCGEIYHVDYMPSKKPGVCDKCGHDLYQREDDKVEAIKHRISVYRDQTEALISYYRDRDLLADVDGNHDPETVCRDVEEILGLTIS
jgi:adenylate kinase